MNGSWKIGRIAGIDVFMHWTFILLLVWVGASHYLEHHNWHEAAQGLLFILTLFAIVVAHELGHATAAKRYGIVTRDITLLPIGGVARLERMPDKPSQELVVALAGPAVNVVLAAAIYFGLHLNRHVLEVSEAAHVGGNFLVQMFLVNVMLAVFNLLPAFPMDGGRVVRALLAMRMDYVRATQVAATLGQAMAVLFAVAGLFGNPFLLFIALFVWVGAAQESSMVQMRAALSGIPVSRAMATHFAALHPGDSIVRAAQWVLAGFQQDFPVVDEGRVVGVVTRQDLSTALAANNPQALVQDVMQREFVTASPREMLYTAFSRLQECHCRTLPVVDNGGLVGLLTMDNVANALMVQSTAGRPNHDSDGDSVNSTAPAPPATMPPLASGSVPFRS
jgi:Zn-dependent protease/CBS domain-containing protein